jgi:putative hemolysin
VARDPNRFLSAAQIGVTFVGFFSASFGADTLAPYLHPYFAAVGLPEKATNILTIIILTVLISFVSIIFGELVPKRLAMQRAEGVSLFVAGPLDVFANIMRPIIWLLSKCSDGVFRLIGGDPDTISEEMSGEEIQSIVETHEGFAAEERKILSDVIDAAGHSITEVMRPRADVLFLDGNLTLTEAAKYVQEQPYSRFPVIGDDFDDVIGFVHVRDLMDPSAWPDKAKFVQDVARTILKFPGTNRLFPCLRQMRDKGIHIAIVLDEYGGTDGICTLEDIIEEMIGDIHDEYDLRENPEIRTSKDGSFSVDGGMTIQDFADQTGIALEEGPYETVAGFILSKLGEVASVGDTTTVPLPADDDSTEEATLTVSRVEGMRIARVKVRKSA